MFPKLRSTSLRPPGEVQFNLLHQSIQERAKGQAERIMSNWKVLAYWKLTKMLSPPTPHQSTSIFQPIS